MIPDSLVNQFISNPVFKTDTRAIFFLLQNPEPVSSDDIATATGLSRKCANKAVKRLTGAGLIQPGEAEARKRAFGVTGWEPQTVTEGTTGDYTGTFTERLDRIEAMIGALLARPVTGAILEGHNVYAPAHEGIKAGHKVTNVMTIQAPDESEKNIQAEMMPESGQEVTGTDTRATADEPLFLLQDKKEYISIPKGTTGTKQAINGTQTDPIMAELDNALLNTGARLAALKAASLLKEKANSSFSDTCAPASVGDEFKAHFGVNVPVGFTDMAAVETMIARKKAGKDIKSPLGYLASIAGKVTPIMAAPAELEAPPVMGSVTPMSSPVTEPRLDHETMTRINAMWDIMSNEQRTPFEATALPKFEKQVGKYKVPLHILAKSVFNAEQLRNHQ